MRLVLWKSERMLDQCQAALSQSLVESIFKPDTWGARVQACLAYAGRLPTQIDI